MAALAKARLQTLEKNRSNIRVDPVKAATTIYQGGIACVDAAGWAVPGSTSATLKARGVAKATVANPGANGDQVIEVKRGVFPFDNLGGDPITRADIGNDCYIVDDQTVARTNGGNTRSIAGKVEDLDSQRVWVRFN